MTDRWAIYMRYSHEEMRDTTTLAVQEEKCQEYIASRDGECIAVYTDEAESGTTVENRAGYQRLLADAAKGKFTHLVVLRWERLHRNAATAAQSKEFLRVVCKIEVHSVYEPSAHDGLMGGLMEGFLDQWNAFTSAQLSVKYRDAKYNIFKRGGYLAGTRLFGYTVGTKPERYVLRVNEDERAGVIMMFELYATGGYSYSEIADKMNKAGYKAVTGRKFTKHAVRTALGNHVYMGKLSYQPTVYLDKEKKHRDYSVPVETIDGIHEPIISRELWEKVVSVRKQRDTIRHGSQRHTPYLLRGLVWCWYCFQHRHEVIGKEIKTFGRCQCRSHAVTSKWADRKNYRYKLYQCVTREQGYECPEKPVRAERIEEVVLGLLFNLPKIIPQNWYDILTHEMAKNLEGKSVVDAIDELKNRKQRVIEMYEDGAINRETMREKIRTIENEIERKLPMLEADSVQSAASFIQEFPKRFRECKGDIDRQNALIRQIIERVYIENGVVVGITFKANIHLMMSFGADFFGTATDNYLWMEFEPNMYYAAKRDESEENKVHTSGRIDIMPIPPDEPLDSMHPRRDSNSRPTV